MIQFKFCWTIVDIFDVKIYDIKLFWDHLSSIFTYVGSESFWIDLASVLHSKGWRNKIVLDFHHFLNLNLYRLFVFR